MKELAVRIAACEAREFARSATVITDVSESKLPRFSMSRETKRLKFESWTGQSRVFWSLSLALHPQLTYHIFHYVVPCGFLGRLSNYGLGFAVFPSVCWQTNFIYNQFWKQFCAKLANFKHFWWLSISKNWYGTHFWPICRTFLHDALAERSSASKN